MTIEDIERLVRRLERSDVTDVEVSDETSSLRLRLAPGPAPRSVEPPPAESHAGAGPDPSAETTVRASAIGRFLLRHPEAAPEPEEGFPRAVASGDILAFLQAGACLCPVVAERDGRVGAPLRPEGSLVGYGTPLFPYL